MSVPVIPQVTVGEADFRVPGVDTPCKTWYKIVGSLHSTPRRRPLITLHGGPGADHHYLLPIRLLAERHSIPVIFFDQLGNGNSTHLPEKKGDTTFWTEQLFIDQIDSLLVHLKIDGDYDLLGHSWGGMLGSRFAARQPKGLKHLVIVSSPADMGLWVQAADILREALPSDVQSTLKVHEAAGTTDSKEYAAAVNVFYERHLCTVKPMPEDMMKSMVALEKDSTVYHTMNGPSEFHVIGSLKNWTMVDEAHKITAPTLLINGKYDEAQDSTVLPFFKLIPKVRWVTMMESSHTCQFEEPDHFIEILGGFLEGV